ncbi:MAG TPA: phospholipid scramblase-related protein [Gemmatimonadaceae bacterium]|nr:phospholipid scramblase-related protein [Gemmatimonadaceae bacterium]
MTTAARATTAPALPTQNTLLVKEHIGAFKAANNFDVYDPASGALVLLAREEALGWLTKLMRFTDSKRYTPFDLTVRTPSGEIVARVSRGVAFLRSTVQVRDGNGQVLGCFRQRLLSLGGAFDLVDPGGRVLGTVRGKWTGWDFRFASGNDELARVSKRWAGIGKEMLTTADNYVLEIAATVPATGPARPLIIAAALCIDMVLKE